MVRAKAPTVNPFFVFSTGRIWTMMPMPMIPFNVLLDVERRAKLMRIAKRQKLSCGALLRSLIDAVAE